jgi:DNA-directed RNA polymerase subunit RPC12/RpoP
MDKGNQRTNSSKINTKELGLDEYVTYICANCGVEASRKPLDDLTCDECASQIMFKKRRNSGIQCEAR